MPINPSVSELFMKLAVLFLAILRESVWILSVLSVLDCRRSPGLSVFERQGALSLRGPRPSRLLRGAGCDPERGSGR